MSRYIYLFFLLPFLSCEPNSSYQDSLKFIKNQAFPNGYRTGNSQIVHYDNEEHICFGDYYTHKKIAIHTLEPNTSHIEFVNLQPITDRHEKIQAYEVINLDTILVLPYYSNILYLINQKGVIWKTINLNPYLKEKGSFELLTCAAPFQFNDTTLIFSLDYSPYNLPVEDFNDLYKYRIASDKAPTLFKIDNIFSDSLSVQFGLYNFYNNFLPQDCIKAEGRIFTFTEDKILFNSAYSDSIYIINPSTLELEKTIVVQSDYSDLMVEGVKIEDHLQNPDLINNNFKSNGQIRRILFDIDQNLYYVITCHKPTEELFPWSIIVLDNEFKKITEIVMDHTKYNANMQICSDGLLISNYYETLNDSDHFEKNSFALFRYE